MAVPIPATDAMEHIAFKFKQPCPHRLEIGAPLSISQKIYNGQPRAFTARGCPYTWHRTLILLIRHPRCPPQVQNQQFYLGRMMNHGGTLTTCSMNMYGWLAGSRSLWRANPSTIPATTRPPKTTPGHPHHRQLYLLYGASASLSATLGRVPGARPTRCAAT